MIWLLDTNIVIHALDGVSTVRDRLNAAEENDRIVRSTIVVAELSTAPSARLDAKRIGEASSRS